MSDRVPPHNLEAEESVLGAMLMSNPVTDQVLELVTAGDFYRIGHAQIFEAIRHVSSRHEKIDVITVGAELEKSGQLQDVGGYPKLTTLMANTAGITAGPNYAKIVAAHAYRRYVIGAGLELVERAYDITEDMNEAVQSHQAALTLLDSVMIAGGEPDDVDIEEFMKRDRETMAPWVIRGIIRRSHKIMIVGGEGDGKSWLLRYIALCAAYGIHPFRHTVIKPIKVLIVDLENPEDALYDSFETILKQVTKVSKAEETVKRLWWRPGGINLRNRGDLAQLEAVIRAREPDLICLGPLYAAYENSSKDFGWETATREVQQAFRKLRRRYDFALMLEDHAPQGETGKRDMRPYGSSFWRRWPEIGIGLKPYDSTPGMFDVGRWRGDRLETDWPDRIIRGNTIGSPWPFVGEWQKPSGEYVRTPPL